MMEIFGMVFFGLAFVLIVFGVPMIFYWLDQEKK
jgi:hypothetical protein